MGVIIEAGANGPGFFSVALGVLGFFFTITAFVCWVNTLSPAFERSLLLGLFCFLPPIAFLWGWAKVGKTKQKENMLVWTASVIPMACFLIFWPDISGTLAESVAEGLKHV